MADKNWQKIRTIFDAALERKAEERAKYVEEICGGDKALCSEVNSLLSAFERADSFMETPAVTKVADIIEGAVNDFKKGTCFGHYEIIEQIGIGGMGEVYLAKDKKLDRKVAIKILDKKFSRNDSNSNRFTREAKAASALNHPNILVIHEIGESEEVQYIVSEFIKGKTLRELFKEKSLKLSEVLDVSIQIATALCAAHEAQIIHRDIKPENIMVSSDGFAKILDFGLAKLVERKDKSIFKLKGSTQNQTAKGMILGTVNYMSPEQAKAERVDERSDIFSFGVLIYEMIAGRTPFAGDSNSETFANLINSEPRSFDPNTSNIPDGIERMIFKMLCKDPNDRYQTMKDVLAELKNLKGNLALDARLEHSHSLTANETAVLRGTTGGGAKSSTAESFKAFSQSIKRHKPLAAFALISVLVGATALIFYFYKGANAAAGDKKSIAVLPIKPINAENRDEIYEIGLADSLIHRLSSIKGFIVRPLSATRQYADIGQDAIAAGKEQKVDYVLASNYQLAGGKIRITAQLFNVANGQIEETYKIENDAGDIFAMQDAISGEVGNLLQIRFATTSSGTIARRGTNNEEAYRLYLQGRILTMQVNARDQKKAIEYFEQAIKLDPNYALAYAIMANAYIWLDVLEDVVPRVEKITEIINKAFELDNNLAAAYVARGQLSLVFEWNLPAAEKDLLRAIELEPNNDTAHWLYALLLAARKQFDEALISIETAQAIDPSAGRYMMHRGRILYYARRYDEAVVQFERLMELGENAFSNWTQYAYQMKGDETKAYEIFMKVQERSGSDHLEVYRKTYETAGWQGVRRKTLEFAKLDEQEFPGGAFHIAKEYALLGEKDQAFEYLNKAVEKRRWLMYTLNVEPAFDNLRDDPRFDELVKRVGLE